MSLLIRSSVPGSALVIHMFFVKGFGGIFY